MATYRKRGGGVQAVIRIVGHDPESRMFATRTQARMWAEQPEARQGVMRNAFRDLRSVPPDQRLTVLDSERYRRIFSTQERDILTNMLRVEPYEPQK